MHPVVIMSYDKGPAISKAVAALEEAGMEVVVLNTKTAKLVQFLGALAGEMDDEEDKPEDDAPPADEPPADEPPADEPPPEEEPPVKESLDVVVNDEAMKALIVEGDSIELSVGVSKTGEKVSYTLNESMFSFWGAGDTAPIELVLEGKTMRVQARLVEGKTELRIGRDWLKANKE